MGYGTNFTSETETGKTLSEPTSIPETTGYEFLYWYEEDEGIAYNFSKIIGNESASTRTLKAKWKPVEYIIKYKVESNVSISKTEFNKVYGKVAEELIKPSKEGYNFVGWFIDNNTFEKPYTIYMDIYEQGKTEYYIYPKWTTEKYRVDFKLHNNAYIYYFQQVNQGERLISPTVPYYEGHRFIGWYYNDRAWNFMTDVVMESFTLMAKWEKVEEVKSNSPSGGNGGSRGGDAATNLQQQQQQKAAAEQPTRQGNQEVNQSSFGTQAVMKSEPIKNVQAKMEGGQLKFTKENGERITGMTKVSVDGKDGVYYFNNNSTLYCGWMKDENNNYHYFGANGKMVTNQEVKVGDKTFKINEKGELDQVGLSVDDKKGIFDRCGVKEYTAEITKTGSINGQAGTLRNNQQDTWSAIIINPITGQKELAKGLTKIVQEDGVHSYYFDQNGIMQIGWLIVEGKLQLFSLKNGRLVTID